MEITEVAIDVLFCLPDDIAFIIVCLDGTTDVVADDAVMPFTNYLGSWNIAVTVVTHVMRFSTGSGPAYRYG